MCSSDPKQTTPNSTTKTSTTNTIPSSSATRFQAVKCSRALSTSTPSRSKIAARNVMSPRALARGLGWCHVLARDPDVAPAYTADRDARVPPGHGDVDRRTAEHDGETIVRHPGNLDRVAAERFALDAHAGEHH